MATFRETALENGFYAAVVPVARMIDFRSAIDADLSANELDGLQQWITGSYEYSPAELTFEAQSVVCVALPRPSYGEVVFEYSNRNYRLYAVDTPFSRAGEDYVMAALKEMKYDFCKTSWTFPRKRFAVQAGLAEYGRNNITYMPGLGSYADYSVFFTDMPPDEDKWRDVTTAAQCGECGVCIKNCPTGAIKPDRFMIDSVSCLAAISEGPGEDFPPFVPKDSHHAVFGCMRCQTVCPMNKEYNANTYPTVHFSESETERLLRGAPYDDLEGELLDKYALLDLKYTANLPRNLHACFELIDSGGECSL